MGRERCGAIFCRICDDDHPDRVGAMRWCPAEVGSADDVVIESIEGEEECGGWGWLVPGGYRGVA